MMASKQQGSTPYLNRRDQYRMLTMVGLLCLVMVAIKLASLPESWYWILPPTDEDVPQAVPLEKLDFRVRQDSDKPLRPGVFRAVADVDEPVQGDASGHLAEADSERTKVPPLSADINADALSGIEDNTLGVRRAEIDAYHQMLDRVRQLPDDVIDALSHNDVAFTVIMLHSGDYRGQILDITGQLQRLTAYPVMENGLGIDRLYEGWVFTNDSGNNPWRFLCTQLPENAVLGDDIAPVKIQLAGYFFKRAGYLSQGGQHVAPTLLAKSFRIVPAPVNVGSEIPAGLRTGLMAGAGLLLVAVILLIVRWSLADRDFATGRLGKLAAARLDADPSDLEALKQIDPVDPAKLFEHSAPADDGADAPSS